MATTGSPANIPLFDDNSAVTPIQAPLNAIAKALNDYLKSVDTGWVTLNTPGGVTGADYAYRVKGGITYLRGSLGVTTGSFPNGYTACGTLPAGARPSSYIRAAIGMYNGYSAILTVNTAGVMSVGASGDRTADTVYVGGVSFPADR